MNNQASYNYPTFSLMLLSSCPFTHTLTASKQNLLVYGRELSNMQKRMGYKSKI
jgi:hypothetical protein